MRVQSTRPNRRLELESRGRQRAKKGLFWPAQLPKNRDSPPSDLHGAPLCIHNTEVANRDDQHVMHVLVGRPHREGIPEKGFAKTI
ncbi:MAG: hypothetical protein ACK52S_22800 [Pirellula sp.]|jgi:hypothetical protein